MVELTLSLDTQPTEFSFFINKPAAIQIHSLLAKENKVNAGLRIKVKPGGCAGFLYEFSWMDLADISDEHIVELDGAHVILGSADIRHLSGSTLDFVENLAGSKFEIRNPNASSVCGCGKSFV